MKSLKHAVMNFIREEEGVTAIEYALIAALIAVAIVAILGTVGGDLNTVFNNVHTALTPATGGGGTGE